MSHQSIQISAKAKSAEVMKLAWGSTAPVLLVFIESAITSTPTRKKETPKSPAITQWWKIPCNEVVDCDDVVVRFNVFCVMLALYCTMPKSIRVMLKNIFIKKQPLEGCFDG